MSEWSRDFPVFISCWSYFVVGILPLSVLIITIQPLLHLGINVITDRTFITLGFKIIFMCSVNFCISKIPTHCLKEALVT